MRSRHRPRTRERRDVHAVYRICYACGHERETERIQLDHVWGENWGRGPANLAPLCEPLNTHDGRMKQVSQQHHGTGNRVACLDSRLEPRNLLLEAERHFNRHRNPCAYACAAKALSEASIQRPRDVDLRGQAAMAVLRFARKSQRSDFVHVAACQVRRHLCAEVSPDRVPIEPILDEVGKIWSETGRLEQADALFLTRAKQRRAWKRQLSDAEKLNHDRRGYLIKSRNPLSWRDRQALERGATEMWESDPNQAFNEETVLDWNDTESGNDRPALDRLAARVDWMKSRLSRPDSFPAVDFSNIRETLVRCAAATIRAGRGEISTEAQWMLDWLGTNAVDIGWRPCEMKRGGTARFLSVLRQPLSDMDYDPTCICTPRRLTRDANGALNRLVRDLLK